MTARTSPSRRLAAVAAAVALALTTIGAKVAWLDARPAFAVDDVGFVDHAYGSRASAPTGEKPQSKLWIADGRWWGSLFDPVSGDFHIYSLSQDMASWSDTGVLVDERASAHMDTLWDEATGKLYVVSAGLNETNGAHQPRFLRFSYLNGTWSLDAGFPVVLGNGGTEAITIAKDSTGMLWAAYTQGANVYVQHTTTNDATWTGRIKLPTNAATVTSDDIAAIIAYDGNKIGVLWSNEQTEKMMFASHVDGTDDQAWTVGVAYDHPEGADDHINLKALQADSAGRVLAAVKTSLNGPDDPLIHLLVLGLDGTWSSHVFGTVAEQHTRAIVQVDDENRTVYMIAANPCCSGGVIYMKSAPLDDIQFAPGLGTPIIASATNPYVNNPTSTKQPVNSATGLVVLAGDDSTRTYLHGVINLGGTNPPEDSDPPQTTILTGPPAVAARSATFTFESSEFGSTFSCSLDGAPAEACVSPYSVTDLDDGAHTFTVAATDPAGNTDPTPAEWAWTVDPTLFADDFESQGLTQGGWIAAVGGDGSVAVEGGVGLGGSYGLHVTSTTAKGAFAYVDKALPAAQDVTLAFDLRVASEGWKDRNAQIIKVYSSGGRVLTLERTNRSWLLRFIDRGSQVVETSAQVPLNTWTRLALQLAIGEGTDQVTFIQDGSPVITFDADLGSTGVSKFRLGTDNERVALDMVFDNVEVTL